MARGITSFTAFTKRATPGGTYYGCPYCSFGFLRQRGNALAMHAKAVASIKAHIAAKHPDEKPERNLFGVEHIS